MVLGGRSRRLNFDLLAKGPGGADWLLSTAAEAARSLDRVHLYVALMHLAKIGRFDFRKDVETARLRLAGRQFRMEFSLDFLKKFLRTGFDVLHLVLHELMHRIDGDLRRPVEAGVPELLANLAADLRVNSEIDATLMGETPDYFRRLYPRNRFPENLLLPPQMLTDLPRGTSRSDLEKVCRERFKTARDPAQAARIYLSAWLDRPSHAALLSALQELLLTPEQLQRIRWLGEHGHADDLDAEAARRLADWLKGKGILGFGDQLEEDQTEDPPLPQGSVSFYEAVRQALVNDPATPRPRLLQTWDRGVLPHVGRRDAYLLAAGRWPGLFTCPLPGPEEEERRVHVYVDASGSTREHWALLYGLILHLREEIGEPVWAFSNKVAAVGVDALRAGRVPTTGGTDFDCVAEHALDHRHRRILVLTDGEAGLDDVLARRLRETRTGVFVVFTEPCESCPLLPLASRHWMLDIG